ncbi:MAG: hypothetical protein IKF78_09330 [Atopobiaceae bacterium]|nr:hypothetical protein [Atopobiaceae bacterium]
MKTVGKIAALAVSASLALTLGACGGSALSSSSSAASSSASSSAASSSASVSENTTDADHYENKAFSINFRPLEGWTFTDITTLNNSSSPIVSTANSDEIDMVAASPDMKSAAIVAIVPPNDSNAGKTADQVLKDQLASMKAGLDEKKVDYTIEETEVVFEGLDRKLPGAVITIKSDGQEIVMAQAVAESDGYFMEILVGAQDKDSINQVINQFKAVAQ